MRASATTWGLAIAAMAAIALVRVDPWQRARTEGAYVSNRAVAARLLPELAAGIPEGASLELQRPDGTRCRIAGHPEAPGLWVWADRELVGPADPDAIDGLWTSLGATTSLRAANVSATEAAIGSAGRIRIDDGRGSFELALGAHSPDGAGLYAARVGTDDDAVWVVERELGDWVAQDATAWVARRAFVLEPAQVREVAFADATVRRGDDGLWRSEHDGRVALLSSTAVDARLGRVLSARMDPLREPLADRRGAPWLTLHTDDGRSLPLWRGEACDAAGERIVIDRGLGRAGCVDARVTTPWPWPGSGDEGPSWIEPRLIPWDYGAVMSIEQIAPTSSRLRRDARGFVIEHDGDAVTTVPEAEVFRWWNALHDARLATDDPRELGTPEVELAFHSDTTAVIRLRCRQLASPSSWLCARDDEPAFAVRLGDSPAFSATSFVDRQLVSIAAGDLRALELSGPHVARQSVHLDLGVWRLDAPRHPEGDAVLDPERVEALSATIAGARAIAWVPTPSTPPLRTIRAETVARDGRGSALELTLWDGCVVAVDGGRAASIGEGTCASLSEDLLIDTPLERVLEDADAVTVHAGDDDTVLVRTDGELSRDDGAPLGELAAALRRWHDWRALGLRTGTPPGAPRASLSVAPRSGEPWVLELGDAWARVRGEPWYYAMEN